MPLNVPIDCGVPLATGLIPACVYALLVNVSDRKVMESESTQVCIRKIGLSYLQYVSSLVCCVTSRE